MERRKNTAPNLKMPDSVKDNLDRGVTPTDAVFYNKYCSICHQKNGLGNDRFPPLSESEWVNGDKNLLISILLNGLQGNLTVKGKSYTNNMPKMYMLSDGNIAQILTYIRQNFNNHSGEVTSKDVSNMRKEMGKNDPANNKPGNNKPGDKPGKNKPTDKKAH
jgi:mono/diheme cytochrome c family protein